MKSIAIIYGVLMLVACLKGIAADFPFEKKGRSLEQDFSPQELKQFTEDLFRFKKYELKKIFKVASPIRWLDDDHIVFSTRRLPGWEAKLGEASRIIKLNVINNTFVESRHQGRLICLDHHGNMIVRRGGIENIQTDQNIDYTWLTGKWGNDLQAAHPPPNFLISNFLCEFPLEKEPPPLEEKNNIKGLNEKK